MDIDQKEGARGLCCQALPPRIAQAVACIALGRHALVQPLSAPSRLLLATIVSCADKDDLSRPITVSRQRLGEMLGCSRASVQRLLAVLVQTGLVRTTQIKSRRLGFQVGTIELASALVRDLQSFGSTHATKPASLRGSAPTHASEEAVEEKSSSKSNAPCQARPVENSRPDRRRLPGGLQVLLDAGLSHRAIVALMALAKRAGQRLQHVCKAAADGIQQARNPFAYVRSLLTRGLDWAWIVRQKAQAQQSEHQAKQHEEALTRARQKLRQAGRIVDRQRSLVFDIAGSAALVADLRSGRSLGAAPLSEALTWRLLGLLDGSLSQQEHAKFLRPEDRGFLRRPAEALILP